MKSNLVNRCFRVGSKLLRGDWRPVAVKLGLLPPPPPESIEVECLLAHKPSGGPGVTHVANYNTFNAGDMLLTSTLRDLVTSECGPVEWTGMHAHKAMTPDKVNYVNRGSGLIVGGGGLFLRDTNPNVLSGWQWSCSLDELARIKVPLVLFAVGYNRFRGQPDFDPIFRDHLIATTEKSVFIGLRNSGSIRAIKGYLPPELHHKIVFQPCMTTLISRLYPHLMLPAEPSRQVVAVNCAFDRAGLRFGDRRDAILGDIAEALLRISLRADIKYHAHSPEDEELLPHLDSRGVPYELVRLYHTSAEHMVEAYASPALTIGMRGHAQMIPFGCRRPILSLISHDKLRWFLEDIKADDWGVEIDTPDLADRLSATAMDILDHPDEVQARIDQAQAILWDVTSENLKTMAGPFGLSAPISRAMVGASR